MIILDGEDEELFFFYMGMALSATLEKRNIDYFKKIVKYVNRVGVQSEYFQSYEIKE